MKSINIIFIISAFLFLSINSLKLYDNVENDFHTGKSQHLSDDQTNISAVHTGTIDTEAATDLDTTKTDTEETSTNVETDDLTTDTEAASGRPETTTTDVRKTSGVNTPENMKTKSVETAETPNYTTTSSDVSNTSEEKTSGVQTGIKKATESLSKLFGETKRSDAETNKGDHLDTDFEDVATDETGIMTKETQHKDSVAGNNKHHLHIDTDGFLKVVSSLVNIRKRPDNANASTRRTTEYRLNKSDSDSDNSKDEDESEIDSESIFKRLGIPEYAVWILIYTVPVLFIVLLCSAAYCCCCRR